MQKELLETTENKLSESIEVPTQAILGREFRITVKSDTMQSCSDAMAAIEKRLDEMSYNLIKYGVTMSYASN